MTKEETLYNSIGQKMKAAEASQMFGKPCYTEAIQGFQNGKSEFIGITESTSAFLRKSDYSQYTKLTEKRLHVFLKMKWFLNCRVNRIKKP
jgi:hypothetical protein